MFENLGFKPNTFGKVKTTKSQKIICMSKENKKTGPKQGQISKFPPKSTLSQT